MLTTICGPRPEISNHYVLRACASRYIHDQHVFKKLDCAISGSVCCLFDGIRLAFEACFQKNSAAYWTASRKCLQLAPVALTIGWVSPKQVYEYKNKLGLQPNLLIRINDCVTEPLQLLFYGKSRVGYDYPDPMFGLLLTLTNPLLMLFSPLKPKLRYVRV